MKYNYEFDMKYTDNPYIDLIVNCVKILGMNAVVKNENQSLHYEDVRSAKKAADYIKFKEGHWDTLKDGEYNESNYMEWNSYYRMLYGLPPAYTLNDEKAYLSATGYDENDIYEDIGPTMVIPDLYNRYFIDMGQYIVPEDMPTLKLEGKYLHELSLEELSMIESCGIMKQVLIDYGEDPNYQYIYHLGDKRVDYYTARKATNFSLLWLPELNTFDIIENKFRRVYERNRKYTISTVYSEAYRFMSYHYDAFIQILIIIQTMVDMISEVQEYIINKDVFDSRTIRYLFESYGIAYYKEIPVKYQIRIIKNVNTLLKYKSSHRNIIDILELFDDDTITVYTYYLMKTKAVSRDRFQYYTIDDVNPKYNTNRDYWLGNIKDISNNKVPLTNVKYNEDEYEFINKYLYGYNLIDKHLPDTIDNREFIKYQPVSGMIARPLRSLSNLYPANSFMDIFLSREEVNWFDVPRYTTQDKYLVARNELLSLMNRVLTEKIKTEFDKLCKSNINENLALNRYYCRRLKYELYGILGIFNSDICNDINFNIMSDAKLEQYFYQVDSIIDDAFAIKQKQIYNKFNKDTFGWESENRFILNHSIPFMTYFEYRDDDATPYIFNGGSFNPSSTIYLLGDRYDELTKLFRETYIISVRNYVEGIFDDLKIDEINNPTPNYIGWVDLNYVLGQLGKSIDELEIGDKVTTQKHNNIPIYSSSYITEVITEDMVGQEYFRKNYDLSFLKVPILDPNAYKVIERYDMRRNYDTITLADPFWDGVSTFDLLTEEERSKLHQSKKNDILSKEFTIDRTKYIGVEASIDLTKMSYQICYFMNMLYDKHRDEEDLYVEVDSAISTNKVRLNDLLTFATALNYIYQGVEPDNIASDMEKNMYINGFNFDTDWNDIYNYLENQHHIYNNYSNEERHDYTYTDEFGIEHEVKNGYGMNPLKKGWMTELYDDFYVYNDKSKESILIYIGQPTYTEDGIINNKRIYINDLTLMPQDTRVGAFLSGRYEQCKDDCITSAKFGLDFGYSDIWNNLNNTAKYDWSTGEFSTIDISWRPTQYPKEDNNSHGLWLDTNILTVLDEATSDLERINLLKKIYYSNTNLYNHLTYMMRTAQSKRMYDIYKIVFESYMETKMNHDFYRLIDLNGQPIYTDENDENSSYQIGYDIRYNKDSEKFPVFIGIHYDNNANEISRQLYYFNHNDDFTDCKYIGEDGHTVECMYNERKLENEGIKEYYVNEDLTNQLNKMYLFPMNVDNYIFDIDNEEITYLINIHNEDIKIPVKIDEDNHITILEGTFDNITVIKDGDDVKIIIHKEDGNDIEKDIKISWKIASDYYEYLQYRNPELYSILIDLKYNYPNVYNEQTKQYHPSDEKCKRIEAICELIVVALEKYFDKKEWRYLFNLIPTANIQNIQNYIMKMVIFFKSWKTQMLDASINYVVDDPFGNHVHILDDMYYNSNFQLLEKIRPKDYKYFHNHTKYKTPIKIRDKIEFTEHIYEPYLIRLGFGEKIYGHKFDYPVITSKLNLKDVVKPSDKVELKIVNYNEETKMDSNGNFILE